MHEDRIATLIERLANDGIDVERERCDPEALRLIARDLHELAAALDGNPEGGDEGSYARIVGCPT